jgi:hypothetical protein
MNQPHRSIFSKASAAALLGLFAPSSFAGTSQDIDDLFLSGLAMNSGIGAAGVSVARTSTRDVAERLFHFPTGIDTAASTPNAAVATDAKGGLAKTPIMPPQEATRRWEVYGALYFYSESQDSQLVRVGPNDPGTIPGFLQVHPGTEIEMFGGTVGIEHHFDEHWSAGFALGGASSDVEMTLAGSSEIETLALTPYVSYSREDLLGSADFWAGLLYSRGLHDFEIRRFAATGQLEFLNGINFQSGPVTHGPFAGVRWIEGSIESYNEVGPTGLFPEQDLKSIASLLGYQIAVPIRMSAGMLVPTFRATWEHEFDDEANNLFGIAMGDRDADAAVLGAGVACYFDGGWNVAFDYEARISSHVEGHYAGLKAGYEF